MDNEPQVPVPETQQLFNLSDLDSQRNTVHTWRQAGQEVFCTTCPFRHSFFVSPKQKMYDIDKDGMPLFREIINT